MFFITKHLENVPRCGCEGAINHLTSILNLKREFVCGTLVDTIVENFPLPRVKKEWIRKWYDAARVNGWHRASGIAKIDRYLTKFSDICGCSCS